MHFRRAVISVLLLIAFCPAQSARRDGQHDFNFEFGTWKTHLRRLQHPLTGSNTWIEYDGTTVVRKLWADAPTWWNSKQMVLLATLKGSASGSTTRKRINGASTSQAAPPAH